MKESVGKILMLVENEFPEDPRVRNEAKKLINHGFGVSVISLASQTEKQYEIIDGINVYRLRKVSFFKKDINQNSDGLLESMKKMLSNLGYILEYIYFTLGCLLVSPYILFKHGFDVIHAHNPPDLLFFVAMFYKVIGKKYILDIHDLSPELYRSRFDIDDGLILKILKIVERISLSFTDLVIVTNQSYKEIILSRSNVKRNRSYIVRNGPNLKRIKPVDSNNKYKKVNRTILGYVGDMNPQDGVDYLLRSLHSLVNELKRDDFYSYIIGTGDSLEDLKNISIALGLEKYVKFTGYIPDEDLRMILSAADICVDPDPSSPLNDVSTWIKIMEYMAFGKPIVTFDLKETRYSARDSAIYVKPNDELEFAKAIIALMDNPAKRLQMGENGRNRVLKHLSWEKVSPNLIDAYSCLFPECKEANKSRRAV